MVRPRTPADPEPVDDDSGSFILDDEEFAAAKQQALDSLGLTYEQLAEQARERRFSSFEARKVWLFFKEG
ncbi:hypothetical protein [Herbidospora cretacea]|uniref:hypothetical protein n=1 Tax=Herbidospora cretacea TaxID=28444 RepID=UPI00077459A9|nr:hypothetical protein [Herbidospora cretacea]